ncbi:hypothetical protein Syun_029639 [Stephania yunnanensis]|uniref:Uncharacterized protein n=1 Tax=Stephania yunnanensis TaxID=152371 RepID=A0AAP0E8C6_9MAGN
MWTPFNKLAKDPRQVTGRLAHFRCLLNQRRVATDPLAGLGRVVPVEPDSSLAVFLDFLLQILYSAVKSVEQPKKENRREGQSQLCKSKATIRIASTVKAIVDERIGNGKFLVIGYWQRTYEQSRNWSPDLIKVEA